MKKLLNPRKSIALIRNLSCSTRHCSQLCRSYMYVPGDKLRMINKIMDLNISETPDITIFDLEDAVSLNNKELARKNIFSIIESGELKKKPYISACIRVNSIESGSVVQDDVDLISNCLQVSDYQYPKMVNITKVENMNELLALDTFLQKKIDTNKLKSPIQLGMMIESCQSIVNLKDLCDNLSKTKLSCFKIHHAVFGSDDYCSTLGVSRSDSNAEVLYARQHFANVIKAYKILPIDMVDIDFNNEEALEKNCKFGMSIGFVGKQVIHPKQLHIVNKCFSPSDKKIQWAKELLHDYNDQKEKKGAFNFKGHMIDMPTILQAENLIHFHNMIIEKESAVGK